jgi:D-glycero-alpha-D-manno-heptose-7-phosphate kinase
MIITKTPFRVSFAGGGSDLASFYERDGYGAVVSSSINKFVYLAIHRFFEERYMLKYSRSENVASIDEIQHPLIRECLKITDTRDFLEITSFADIPSSGSGLGSSSAFCVGLVNALSAFRRQLTSKERCAELACEVEIERLGEPIGKQDQYAAALGGLNYVKFRADGSVESTPIRLDSGERTALNSRLLMFFTGITRKASGVLSEQNRNMIHDQARFQGMCEIRDGADRLAKSLSEGDLDAVGREMHAGWLLKKTMANGISSPDLDAIYDTARAAGSLGGKLLGAGGGGFFLLYCQEGCQPTVRQALSHLREVEIETEREGTRIIFYDD